MKSKVDKLDTGKLEITPVDLSKLSNVVKNNTFSSELIDNISRISRVKFKGIFLKQDSVSFLHKKVVNSYISYT